MPTMIEVACERCGSVVRKPAGEVARSLRLGRRFFCSSRCSAAESNLARRRQPVIKVCPQCGQSFDSDTGKKASTFCSRSCASKGSMTEERREAQRRVGRTTANLNSAVETLKRREAWKYDLLRGKLERGGRQFEFEYPLGEFVFDLALLDQRVLVEFDGAYHDGNAQRAVDRAKDAVAKAHGYALVRRAVVRSTVIDPVTIEGL